MSKSLLWSCCAVVLLLAACVYDNEEELFEDSDCPTLDMSLETDIQPILESNGCVGCHSENSGSGGVNLETYDGIKAAADNGTLLGSVNWDGSASEMPLNGSQIDECLINKIEAWITQGAQNN